MRRMKNEVKKELILFFVWETALKFERRDFN